MAAARRSLEQDVVADTAEKEAADTLFELLEPVRGQIATASTSVWVTTDHALGRLASVLGAHETAIVYLERALAEYGCFPAPTWRGQADQEAVAEGVPASLASISSRLSPM